jgi:hypothetical protein
VGMPRAPGPFLTIRQDEGEPPASPVLVLHEAHRASLPVTPAAGEEEASDTGSDEESEP